ncbi:MAG TPA: L,D-transpeptidase [Flavisolibacter sp.]
MKTAIVVSCLLVGSSLVLKDRTEAGKTMSVTGYKTSAAKRSAATGPVGSIHIVIDKSNYELYVYDSKGWYATYPVVFGNSTLADKRMEGDRCTPEGSFRIVHKRVHDKWTRYMGLDYPTRESIDKFNQLKKRGAIPASASPGGGIGIHGTFPHEDFVVDRYKNWTNGCIALKRSDVEELYRYVPTGTPVRIQK